jgi:hypothetical protein
MLDSRGIVKTSVIVPVLYEETRLRETLKRLERVRDRIDLEILLVVDVPDPSREAEARLANDPVAKEVGAQVEYRAGERGFGEALRRGFAVAHGDVVVPFMADVCDDPEDILRLVARIQEGYDVVAGSRYMRGGGIVGNTSKQRLSRLYSMLVRMVGGPRIHDVSNAFKAYRRSVIKGVPTEAASFDISVELTVKAAAAGFRISEIPTVWTNRREGTSRFHMRREVSNYGRWLLYAFRNRTNLRRRDNDTLARSER